jgi:CcmD family protein
MDPREFQFTFYGLLIVWVIITAYVISLAMRERRLKQELDRVRRMVEKS